ncbi:PREDICTED: heat shock protein beta-1 isoform X2 [Eufriesea mexicana]|uniref:heat shock protein beta-1 isoform X2 n=1 Tax=Eufriesea mexicana TaxID=516756 RepID=UPI00083C667D|nr:PREDICTED: heat shock protein beta-1 isoform X2 [Eufriesea mexicana]
MASSGIKRDIPIKLDRDFSVLDTEFSNIRERFEAEMKKMEDEMTRFRSELTNHESSFFKSVSSTEGNAPMNAQQDSAWLDGLNSPLIMDEGDRKMLKLRFDVSQYAPEEIVVKSVDNKLLVYAKHEEKTESKSVYREYNREFLLPKGTNPESIKSSLSKDGVLTVEAPLPAINTREKLIPISHQ